MLEAAGVSETKVNFYQIHCTTSEDSHLRFMQCPQESATGLISLGCRFKLTSVHYLSLRPIFMFHCPVHLGTSSGIFIYFRLTEILYTFLILYIL